MAKSTWTYGDRPHSSWGALAKHLKAAAYPPPKKKKFHGLADRVSVLEQQLKGK